MANVVDDSKFMLNVLMKYLTLTLNDEQQEYEISSKLHFKVSKSHLEVVAHKKYFQTELSLPNEL